MCCRYYFDDETIREIRSVVNQIDANLNGVRCGDVLPSDPAPIITGGRMLREGQLHLEMMRWGFIGFDNRQLMINARCESAMEKRSFRESVRSRRCVIPAKHFYEWDAEKTKNTFYIEEIQNFYMAGFYNFFHVDPSLSGGKGTIDEFRYTILTTEANDSMRPVHDRMPLILPESQIRDWIFDDGMVEKFLKQSSPELSRYAEYEQLSLF